MPPAPFIPACPSCSCPGMLRLRLGPKTARRPRPSQHPTRPSGPKSQPQSDQAGNPPQPPWAPPRRGTARHLQAAIPRARLPPLGLPPSASCRPQPTTGPRLPLPPAIAPPCRALNPAPYALGHSAHQCTNLSAPGPVSHHLALQCAPLPRTLASPAQRVEEARGSTEALEGAKRGEEGTARGGRTCQSVTAQLQKTPQRSPPRPCSRPPQPPSPGSRRPRPLAASPAPQRRPAPRCRGTRSVADPGARAAQLPAPPVVSRRHLPSLSAPPELPGNATLASSVESLCFTTSPPRSMLDRSNSPAPHTLHPSPAARQALEHPSFASVSNAAPFGSPQ